MDSTETLLAMLLCSVVLISLVAIVGGFLHHRAERLLKHEERMKALELGRAMPDDVATTQLKSISQTFGSDEASVTEGGESLPRKMISTAFWVAFWGFVFSAQGGAFNQAVSIAIAVSTGAVGVAAVVCGTILALRAPAALAAANPVKPKIEEDALDVVSTRG